MTEHSTSTKTVTTLSSLWAEGSSSAQISNEAADMNASIPDEVRVPLRFERPDAGQPSSLAGVAPFVAPLKVSPNRWRAASIFTRKYRFYRATPDIVDRKVRGLINKLTVERFDSISNQIIAWANKSEKEHNGQTLIQVIRLVFEAAIDQDLFSSVYARLCRKMMEKVSPKVYDDGIRNGEGNPIAGGQLFRKYLLNRCQEDFERGWANSEKAAKQGTSKALEDQALEDGESVLFSDEYYAAQKAKRQGLGLIKFIGELFKLQLLTERIMHECVKKLLANDKNPGEEEIGSLCTLLNTVGQILDTSKARTHVDVYFSRMREFARKSTVKPRLQFMLQDVIELRERKWVPRNQIKAPTTLVSLHQQVEEKAAHSREAHILTVGMPHGVSRRDSTRGGRTPGPNRSAGGAVARRMVKAGDLSRFGKIVKSTPKIFDSTSASTEKSTSPEVPIRQSPTNMFSMLSGNPEIAAEVSLSKSSADLGPGGAPELPIQRKKLNLLPSIAEPTSTPAESSAHSEDEVPSMSEADAKTRVEEDSKEFFGVRDLDEAEVYFAKMPTEHRHLLVDKLVTRAIESKEADAQIVADLFDRAVSKNLCSPASFEEGFLPTATIIDDIVIDAPKALNLFASMIRGAHLHEDEERQTRLVNKSVDSAKLVELVS